MVNKNIKRLGALLSAALLFAGSSVHADDTEIYIGRTATGGGTPLVFFYIEYTPNLGSTICTGVTTANIDTQCSQIAAIKTYMSANDLSATDTTIDQFELTRAALKRVLIGLGDVKLGLLMAHDNLANCAGGPLTTTAAASCSQGGYILQGLTEIDPPSATFNPATATSAQLATELAAQPAKAALFAKLDALPSPKGGFSHENQNKEIYFELFRYLTGQGIYNGHNGGADYNTTTNDNKAGAFNLGDLDEVSTAKYRYECASGYTCDTTLGTGQYTYVTTVPGAKFNGDFAPLDNGNYISTKKLKWDTAIEDGSNYRAALTQACEKVYVINVVDGGGNSANDADTAIKASLASGGLGFNVSGNDPGFEEMVKWLYDKDLADGTFGTAGDLLDNQNVISYFIAKQPQQVDDAAKAGGTGYAIALTDDAQSVIDTISKIFDQINDASTTFTSAAIPVNVFNRSEVLDNAYLALFQPNDDGEPVWVGNVKKLKLDIYRQCNQFDTVNPSLCVKWENRLRLIDTLDQDAIAPSGRIKPEALTFWTNGNGYDLYDNLTTTNGVPEVAGRDGRTVYRGGSGQNIPNMLNATNGQGVMNWANSTSGRRLYTEATPYTATGSGLLDIHWSNISFLWPSIYNTSNPDYNITTHWPTTYTDSNPGTTPPAAVVTAPSGTWSNDVSLYTQDPDVVVAGSKTSFYTGDSGYSTTYSKQFFQMLDLGSNLFAYMRGFDVMDEDGDGVTWETRRWVMSDPLHSRPLPINYGVRPSSGYSADNQDIRIIVGGNDGYLRMIRNTNADGSESGREDWAFMPREVMKYQKQLMNNVPYGTPFHPYGIDGAPTAYVKDTDGNIDAAQGDKVWLYFGLRRGGRAYYGLDITDPDNPKFLWKVDPTTAGFSELGYSFAQPVVRELDWGTGRKPVLIVGGGYDLDKDRDSPTAAALGTNDNMGRAIYIIDAETGALVWKVTGGVNDTDVIPSSSTTYFKSDMDDSIPSEVTAIDSNNNGLVDRIYVGDTGGVVWRVDLTGTDRGAWKATKLMNVGRHITADLANDRRFFYAPDVVPSRDGGGYFDAVVIGSGNREHPRQTWTDDYMYMYKDRTINGPLTAGFTAITPSDLGDVTNNCIQQVGTEHCAVSPDLTNGWRLHLTENGEKVLASALTLRGVIYFSSYLPNESASSGSSCSPYEGSGYLYAISLQNAVAVFNYDTTNTVVDSDGKQQTLQIEDRRRKLLSPGIPSENVYISYRDEDGNTFTGILSSDLQAGDDLGVQQWSTYWFEKQK